MQFRLSFDSVLAMRTQLGALPMPGVLLVCALLVSGGINLSAPPAAIAAAPTVDANHEAKRKAKPEVCRQAQQNIREALSRGETEEARPEADALFRNGACATRLT